MLFHIKQQKILLPMSFKSYKAFFDKFTIVIILAGLWQMFNTPIVRFVFCSTPATVVHIVKSQ